MSLIFYFLFGGSIDLINADSIPINKCWEDLTTDKTYKIDGLKYADSNTLEVIELPYLKDKDNVFYMCEILEGADPDTFEYLYNSYTKDKNNVYYFGDKVYKADQSTFEPVIMRKFYDAKDIKHKYQDGERISLKSVVMDLFNLIFS